MRSCDIITTGLPRLRSQSGRGNEGTRNQRFMKLPGFLSSDRLERWVSSCNRVIELSISSRPRVGPLALVIERVPTTACTHMILRDVRRSVGTGRLPPA